MGDTIAAAIISGVAAVLVAVINAGKIKRYHNSLWQRWHSRNTKRGLEEKQLIDAVLSEIRAETKADRVLLISGHNGGGYPSPKTPYYVTVLNTSIESAKAEAEIIRGFVKMPVDRQYREMVLELLELDHINVWTDKLNECMLKDIYSADKICHSKLVKIYINSSRLIFLSVNTKKKEGFNSKERVAIMQKANQIRGLFT